MRGGGEGGPRGPGPLCVLRGGDDPRALLFPPRAGPGGPMPRLRRGAALPPPGLQPENGARDSGARRRAPPFPPLLLQPPRCPPHPRPPLPCLSPHQPPPPL